jgi:hypothetical protein
MAMNPPQERPRIVMAPHRPPRLAKRLALPLVVILVATLGLALRAANPDWRGLSDEMRGRLGSLFGRREKTPLVIARSDAAPSPKPAASKPKDQDAWDDIQRAADKLKADREEAERLKDKAAEDLAKNPPPPRHGPVNPNRAAAIAEMQRRHAEAFRRMEAHMDEHQRLFDEMVRRRAEAHRRFTEEFARAVPRGFGNPPHGFDGPLPGMDRMLAPLPGQPQPQIHEDSGEEVRDGVKRTWRTRVLIMNLR